MNIYYCHYNDNFDSELVSQLHIMHTIKEENISNVSPLSKIINSRQLRNS